MKFRLLYKNEVDGHTKLRMFKYLRKSEEIGEITDYALMLGGISSDDRYEQMSLTDRSRTYRPVVSYSAIKDDAEIVVGDILPDGVLLVKYGEYPQKVLSIEEMNDLNAAYMHETGKVYTADSYKNTKMRGEFRARIFPEYQWGSNKYIKIDGDDISDRVVLSHSIMVNKGTTYWFKVSPVYWYVDLERNVAVSASHLFAGIQYSDYNTYITASNFDYDKSNIKKYIDNYFSKEIVPSTSKKIEIENGNPYNFVYDEVRNEDLIRGAVLSDVSVFLHGKSSDGKSARVKQIDPDCEVIYMRNATPDSLNGKSVYNANTGEMIDIPPSWYSKVVEKCEAEPDKLHIVFFDELTNALPSIQGMAFNIILEKEVNGKWKLPDNARIVAAGNDLEDSLAANVLAEPLFNRFAHVYINTTVDDWLRWASSSETCERIDYVKSEIPRKIHPAIYSYIAYKSYSGRDVLRTKYDGVMPNADPRKWEMASKVLYRTNNPMMLKSLVGDDLTLDFVAFTKKNIITVDDVINGLYGSREINMNISEKFLTAVGLSHVDMDNFEVVRNFVNMLGAEVRAVFDSMWAYGDDERFQYIMELDSREKVLRK